MIMTTNPAFLFVHAMNSLALGMNLFIIAVGLTLIFGVLRVINFAHGAFFMVGAYVLLSFTRWFEHPAIGFWIGAVAAMVTLGLIAYFVERHLLCHLYEKEHLLQLLFTFALVLIIGDITKIIWGPLQHSVSYPPGFNGAVNLGISYYPAYLLFLILLGPIIALFLWVILEYTRWGRIIRAARLDREMLLALGTNVKAVYSIVFVVGSALAGLGGALAVPRMAIEPGMDSLVIIDCFIIVIIGGLGSMWGSFLGAIILGISTIFGTLIFQEWEIVVVYMLLIIVLLWRPSGLLGTPEKERH
ncbi:MAG: High-affinity branched-chain amino acid transport system permease protein LivH [Alphaproteobacteria bacterium MarineAlpha3_Bin5]|nr:branched-chain amino acid ABC transporter permease [Magnetovibrio sp.]PPR76738.1 MAG: High-affinity branched-chain amino acid transport system permease protein LivH [Alphaproteobacteria bacterium MarineAlpha3_Bin5]